MPTSFMGKFIEKTNITASLCLGEKRFAYQANQLTGFKFKCVNFIINFDDEKQVTSNKNLWQPTFIHHIAKDYMNHIRLRNMMCLHQHYNKEPGSLLNDEQKSWEVCLSKRKTSNLLETKSAQHKTTNIEFQLPSLGIELLNGTCLYGITFICQPRKDAH
uniref:Uncharacterized protein n=1 Tax=Glossina pallidipes TaxID=7398 RepID=A0A1B0ADP7_GLOPL